MGKVGVTLRRIFHGDDGLVTSMYLVWLQVTFDTLTGLFNRVGIWTNVVKRVKMIYRP